MSDALGVESSRVEAAPERSPLDRLGSRSVGSGAGGGQMAYTLALEGLKVLVMEAGRMVDPIRETAMFHTLNQAPLRGEKTPDKQYGFYDHSVASGWQIPGEPYTNASDEEKRQFAWWRQRMMGGRTNHWGRVSLRNGPYDFETRSRQGIGFDWPVTGGGDGGGK